MRSAALGLLAAAALAAPLAAQQQAPPELTVIWGSSSDDVWVAGSGATAFRFNGTSWTPTSVLAAAGGTARGMSVYGIHGTAPDDVWIIGENGGAPFAARWNGTQWSPLPAPPRGTRTLSALGGAGPREIVMLDPAPSIEDTTFVLRWNGAAWTRRPVPVRLVPAGVIAAGRVILVPGYLQFDPRPDTRNRFGVVAQLAGAGWTMRGSNGRAQTDTMIGAYAWHWVHASGDRVIMQGTRINQEEDDIYGPTAARLYSAGAWRSLPTPPEWAREAPSRVFLLGNGFPIALPGSAAGPRRWTGVQWEEYAPALIDPRNGQPRPIPATEVWSPADGNVAFLVSGTRVMKIASGSTQVIFDTQCLTPTSATAAMCRTIGGGVTPVAPAPATTQGQRAVEVPRKRATPPRGLPTQPGVNTPRRP